ncbi:MAG: hypothetical protein EA401_01510 [Planctomycetota bacterium]|nr:MAG: hypothetical protein EA401_01510 [Planctomycetota bacterium]
MMGESARFRLAGILVVAAAGCVALTGMACTPSPEHSVSSADNNGQALSELQADESAAQETAPQSNGSSESDADNAKDSANDTDNANEEEQNDMGDLAAQLQAVRERHPFTWIGLSVADAQRHAEEAGIALRVVRIDGERQDGSRQRQAGRIDVDVQQGLILAAREDQGEGNPLLFLEGVTDTDLLPFIGMSEDKSQAQAEAAGRPWRVHTRDGEGQMLTMDYVEERVNAVISDGHVVAASGG